MNTKLKVIIILVFSILQTGVIAQNAPAYVGRIDSLLTVLESKQKAMVSLTITQYGQVVYCRATGFIDNTTDKAVASTPQTRYHIGSISKMFTAIMILQLVEEKKLSLNTPLSKFYTKVPNSDSITIADLLNHHSGVHNFTNSEDYPKWMTISHTRAQLMEMIEEHKPAFAPHAKAEYSNTNFVLLGYIIEDLTRKSYKENLSTRITSRIGLKNTMVGSRINHASNEASSFEFTDGKWVVLPETDMSIPGGAGAVISTTPDLTSFINALFEGKLISESSLKTMTTMKDGFGLGIFKIPFSDKSSFGHNGGIDGFSSSLAYFPEDKVAIAFSSNALKYSMNDILIGILSCYFDKPYKIPDFKTVKLSEEKLAAYEGEYNSDQLPLVIMLKLSGDKLTAQASGQPAFLLDAISETEFRFDQAGIIMIFNVSAGARIDGFTLKQGKDYVYKRIIK